MNHDHTDHTAAKATGGHGGHSRWMMVACCVPMLLIAVAIVASGAGWGFLIVAVGCTTMMALMMSGMSDGSSEDDTRHQR